MPEPPRREFPDSDFHADHKVVWSRRDNADLGPDFAKRFRDDFEFSIARERLLSALKYFETAGYRIRVDTE